MKRQLIILVAVLLSCFGTALAADSATALVGSWSGKLSFGANSLNVALHIQNIEGEMKCTFDSPDQGAKGLACRIESITDHSIAIAVVNVGATYQARLEGDKLVGTFRQGGVNLPLTLQRGEYKPLRPQTPKEPYPYKTEEVQFTNSADNVVLAGTLTYPVGYENLKSVPVVVMVSGSGLQNRDEEIFDHKPFLVIADHLARCGIASLRYDDRGCGSSTSGNRPLQSATTLDFKRDAQAAIDYIRQLHRFGSVGILGHSEGANIAFMLGAEKGVDFVISLAGIGVRCDKALTAQYNRIARSQGQPYDITTEQYRRIVESSKNAWMAWFIDYDPSADIAATTCPTFALNGDKDCQVISSLNLSAIEQTLPHNELSLTKEYAGLNHLFQSCQTGLPAEYNAIEQSIAPEVLKDIADWIKSLK